MPEGERNKYNAQDTILLEAGPVVVLVQGSGEVPVVGVCGSAHCSGCMVNHAIFNINGSVAKTQLLSIICECIK